MNALPRTVEWVDDIPGHLCLLDQTLLPTEVRYRDCRTVKDVWEAIRVLRVRGAPAIGVAAAYGVVLGMQDFGASAPSEGTAPASLGARALTRLAEIADYLRTSRPTAVNLFWAIDRLERKAREVAPTELTRALLAEARRIHAEDAAMCRAIGRFGGELVQPGNGILTHCNAGSLATAEYGTALAVMYAAAESGKHFRVYADETRPLLQGSRLTAWELQQAGIDVTIICDSMAGQVMREGKIQLVIVGADRIAGNGDTANKIGTYSVAVLAKAHGIPFYVAAPSSTFDGSIPDGSRIPIEQRDPAEVTQWLGRIIAPAGVGVYNPAFDVTPAELIAGIITEKGIIRPVSEASIRRVFV